MSELSYLEEERYNSVDVVRGSHEESVGICYPEGVLHFTLFFLLFGEILYLQKLYFSFQFVFHPIGIICKAILN